MRTTCRRAESSSMCRANSAGTEEIGAAPRALRCKCLDGVLGDSEEEGYFLLGKALDFSEKEHFATAFRKRVNGLGQQRNFLFAADQFHYVASLLQDGRLGIFRYGNQIRPALAVDKIPDGVSRDREQ